MTSLYQEVHVHQCDRICILFMPTKAVVLVLHMTSKVIILLPRHINQACTSTVFVYECTDGIKSLWISSHVYNSETYTLLRNTAKLQIIQWLTFVVSLFHFPLFDALAAASKTPKRWSSLAWQQIYMIHVHVQ